MARIKEAESSTKVRKNVMLTKSLNRKIEEAARKLNASQSEVVSKAVIDFLGKNASEKRPAIFDLSGAFECEHTDLSIKYKHYLAKAKKK